MYASKAKKSESKWTKTQISLHPRHTQLSPITLSQFRVFLDQNWPYCRFFTKRCGPYSRSQFTPLSFFSIDQMILQKEFLPIADPPNAFLIFQYSRNSQSFRKDFFPLWMTSKTNRSSIDVCPRCFSLYSSKLSCVLYCVYYVAPKDIAFMPAPQIYIPSTKNTSAKRLFSNV